VASLLGSLSGPAPDQSSGASSSADAEAAEDERLDGALQALLFPTQSGVLQGQVSSAATAPPAPSLDWLPVHFQLAVEMERTADAWALCAGTESEQQSHRARAAPLLGAALHIQNVLHGETHVFVAQLQQKLDALAVL
jgi:hypothetical protein